MARFTVTGDTISLATEEGCWRSRRNAPRAVTRAAAWSSTRAGNLYLATGDNTNPFESSSFTPIDERAGRQDYDSQRTSGNTNDLRGKVLRIHPEADGTYTIPAGNLFAPGTAQTRPEIYAMGFRNPFRIGLDKLTNTLFVADYGPDAQAADPNRGPEGTVEWNIVHAGQLRLALLPRRRTTPTTTTTFPSGPSGPTFNCAAPVNNSPNNTGLTNLPPARSATVDYDYSGNPLFPEIGGGGAPMGGPVYRFDAACTSDRKWPALLRRQGDLRRVEPEQDVHVPDRTPTARSVVDINQLLAGMTFLRPMDFEFGPDGALYLIEWGTGFGGNNDDSGIYRIDYIAGDRAPIAVASAQPDLRPDSADGELLQRGLR